MELPLREVLDVGLQHIGDQFVGGGTSGLLLLLPSPQLLLLPPPKLLHVAAGT